MKTRLSGLLWLTGITATLLWVLPGFPQEQLPDLAQVKGAAERGDAQAQDRLGDSYEGRFSFSTAAEWFRKAAEQGVSHAQWRLGKMLLDGRKTFGESSIAVPKGTDEGVKWLLLAANQGLGGCSIRFGLLLRKGQRGEARLHGGLQVVSARLKEEWAVGNYEARFSHPEN